MENVIEVKNVGIKFRKKKSLLRAKKSNEFWALKDVNFEVKKGEVLGILGKNGAGKSTLLTMLAGIISPSKGEIVFNTNSVSLLSLSAGFVPFLSGRKNIILSGMLLGLTKNDMLSKMDEIIEYSGLEEFIDEPVINYSSGMKTRLGFSTAINIDPDVILIDEVLGVGDAEFKKKSSETLKQKISENKTTAIIVSHNENTVRKLCSRIVYISRGQSVFCGDVEEGIDFYKRKV